MPRNEIAPEHFASWVEWARANSLGLDFNPTFFSHPLSADGFTLSNEDEGIRKFWVEHGNLMLVPTICLSEYWTREPNLPTSVMEHVKVKSFNVEDAAIASKLIREKIVVREGEQRDIFKDDVKIVGSACALKAVAIATEDVKTMARYVARVSKKCPEANGLRAVLISQPFIQCLV